jgi:tRNA-binding EMAP/Myf-like protein
MDITFREIREFGECLVLFDQHPSEISLPALGNTYTTISMNLKHAKDVGVMAQAMLLDGEEKDLLGSLKVGEAIVKSQGRIPKPFRILVPEFSIKKGVADNEMVQAHMASVLGPMGAITSGPGLVQGAAIRDPDQSAGGSGQVSIEARFLSDVRTYPDSGIAERYKRLGLSVRQGQKLKAYLIKSGLITEAREHTHTGRLTRIRLTEKARGFLPAGDHDRHAA